MRPSLRLGRVAGIDVGVHWTVIAIAALLVSTLSGAILPANVSGYSGGAYLVTALFTALLFLVSIVAHELGHSLVARRNGVRVRGITLFALGGVATLDGDAATPGAAARIAAAGPAVSVVTGLGLLAAAAVTNSLGLLPDLLVAGLAWLGFINLSLAVFNLIPALPLDGGRVLQAFLWRRRGNRHEATISAARLGRWLGWALVLFGLWELTQGANGLFTALIGWFVIGTAKAEAWQARQALQAERGGFRAFPFPPFPWAPPSGPPAGGPSGGFGPFRPTPPRPGSDPRFGSDPRGGSWPYGGFGPGGPTPPWPGSAPTRPSTSGEVIDVDGRPADSQPVGGRR